MLKCMILVSLISLKKIVHALGWCRTMASMTLGNPEKSGLCNLFFF